MLNTMASYQEAGRRCAEARNQHDEARAQAEKRWLTDAIALEQHDDKSQARLLFDDAYRAARNVPRPEPFR